VELAGAVLVEELQATTEIAVKTANTTHKVLFMGFPPHKNFPQLYKLHETKIAGCLLFQSPPSSLICGKSLGA
jgi:hypothetical protein